MMKDWARRAVSAEEAVGLLQSGMNVFVHGAAATPTPLLKSMVRRDALEGVRLYHMHTAGETPFVGPGCEGRFFSVSLFTGPALRKPIEDGRADFMPIFLSDIPALFRSGRIRLDAAILQVSPPDMHGCCTLGTSVDTAQAGGGFRPRHHRGDQRADAAFPREHGGAVRADRRLHPHGPPPHRTGSRAGDRGGGAHRRDHRGAGRGRFDAADGHRSDTGCGAPPVAREAGPGDPHRDVLRPRRRTVRSRRDHQPVEKRPSAPHRHEFRERHEEAVPFRPRQPAGRIPSVRSDQRHLADPAERQGRGDQLVHPGGPDGPGLRRLDRPPDLFGHRRPDGLHPRCGAFPGRQADPGTSFHGRPEGRSPGSFRS